jgi:hypothetical protein
LEGKRLDISEREIILAFPCHNGIPRIEDQQTFAYLPVKDFGLKVGLRSSTAQDPPPTSQFLIHADFILTAN